MRAAGSLRSKPSLALRPPDRDVVASDDADQNFDVSVRQVLGRHLLSLFPLRLQRPPGFSQLEQVDSQNSAKNEKKAVLQRAVGAGAATFRADATATKAVSRSTQGEDRFYRQK